MQKSQLNQLIGLTPDDLELLKVLSNIGAATAEEVALKMARPGDDLTSQFDELVQRNLVETRPLTVGDETVQVYLVDPLMQKSVNSIARQEG
jgi:DNA-binding MarR family transcriptional regulator